MKPIVIGAVAYDAKVVPIWEGIKNYFLNENVPMDFVLFSNYEAQVAALFARSIDIAWNTNVAFVVSDRRLNGCAKLLAMRDTDLSFTTKMIVPSNSSCNKLTDVKGKKVAFGSRDSAQAAIMPEYYLQLAGLHAGKDYEAVRFDSDLGKHGDTGNSENDVLDALRNGTADAGAIGESTWLRVTTGGTASDLRCIWTSPEYSHCNFTALDDYDQSEAKSFVSTLLKMDYNNPEHRPILEMEGLKRWVEGSREGYKDVFEAMDATGYLKEAIGVATSR